MTVLANLDLSDFWDPSEFATSEYVDEFLTDDLLARVEAELGYRLPAAYVALCRDQNGGAPIRTCHRAAPTRWTPDHIAITNIKAIGFKNAWSLCGEIGQGNTLKEWGYPAIGVYFADCPSGGHDMLCLDYSTPNDHGGPRVVHVDQGDDFRVTFVADSFEAFLAGLEADDAFETDDDPSLPSMSSRLRDGIVDFGKRHPRALYWTGVLTALVVLTCLYFFTNRASP